MVVVLEGTLTSSASAHQNDPFILEVLTQVADESCEVLDVVVKGGIPPSRVGASHTQLPDGVLRRESGLQMCKICCVGPSCQAMDED